MIFGGDQHECDIYIGDGKVDIVTFMRHLFHTLTNDVNNSLFIPLINDFNVNVNTF